MKSLIIKCIIILFIPFFFSCASLNEVLNGIPNVFGGKPEKVKYKMQHPISDSVRFSALWIGHASVLLQIEDKVILIDPVFDDVIGELMLRKVEAGLDLKNIPKLDMILISHSHMDHLSLTSLRQLDTRFPDAALVYPYGVEKYLQYYNMPTYSMKTGNSAEDFYFGETMEIKDIKVTTVFADHSGGRFYVDQNTGYGFTGYMIEYKDITVFFAGDTEYNTQAYKALGNRFTVDLALIPIGPCADCERINFGNHVGTFGAMLIFDDLKAKYMIPIHYGSSVYGSNTDQPLITLKELIEKHKTHNLYGEKMLIPYKDKIKILDEGEQIVFEYKNDTTNVPLQSINENK
jgi:N-acyl-phosphatidylethanolamine-hydrolysing phospholipase D